MKEPLRNSSAPRTLDSMQDPARNHVQNMFTTTTFTAPTSATAIVLQ